MGHLFQWVIYTIAITAIIGIGATLEMRALEYHQIISNPRSWWIINPWKLWTKPMGFWRLKIVLESGTGCSSDFHPKKWANQMNKSQNSSSSSMSWFSTWVCYWKCSVPLLSLWFSWSLSLWKMAISLGIYPTFSDKPTSQPLLNVTAATTGCLHVIPERGPAPRAKLSRDHPLSQIKFHTRKENMSGNSVLIAFNMFLNNKIKK